MAEAVLSGTRRAQLENHPQFQGTDRNEMARRAPSHYRAGTAGGQHLLVYNVDVRRKDCSIVSHAR